MGDIDIYRIFAHVNQEEGEETMKYYGANPIYDTVFKYLMEDERIAMTILSALLKQKVVAISQRAHEYSNITKNDVTMFRIDFAATVRDEEGKEKHILIELQKTWVETETLRFRQYLGAQYNKKENIVGKGSGQHALPMVAVYLLGHRVGDIEEPVVYVSHKPYDYNGVEVKEGMPDPFVSSLTHDSIIVQIPLLHGRVNPRLEEVLFCFDQTNCSPTDRQVIEIDESRFAGNPDMEHIMRRLISAASNPNVRQDMNVEDEYFTAIEDRDTAIMCRDKTIAEQDRLIEQKSTLLEQKDAQLEQKDAQLEQKNAQLEQKDAQLEQKENALQAMVKALKDAGMSAERISSMTGLDENYISSI